MSANIDSLVTIPIEYIKLSNIKLLEREHLIEVLQVKDNTINSYKEYKLKADSIIRDCNTKYMEEVKTSNRLRLRIEEDKKLSIYKYAGAGLLGFLISILILR